MVSIDPTNSNNSDSISFISGFYPQIQYDLNKVSIMGVYSYGFKLEISIPKNSGSGIYNLTEPGINISLDVPVSVHYINYLNSKSGTITVTSNNLTTKQIEGNFEAYFESTHTSIGDKNNYKISSGSFKAHYK